MSSEWTREDECDPFAKFTKKDPFEVPGPIDRNKASHYCLFNLHDWTVETWAAFGELNKFNLKQRVRPMIESEVILCKLEGHSREAVLKAFGIQEPEINSKPLLKKPKNTFSLLRSILK